MRIKLLIAFAGLAVITAFGLFINSNHSSKYSSNYSKINLDRDEEEENEIPGLPSDDWFEHQRAFPFEEIPNEERLRSIEGVKRMPVQDLNRSAAWILAGPTNIEGRVTTIAIHPTNPQIVYIGTANGGVWRSTNFCQSWTSVFDGQNTSSIGAIAIDPNDPNIIYCGSGESNSLRSYYPGTGMFKSSNGGVTWTNIGLANCYSFGNIAINPFNSQIVYAAAVGSTRRKNIERGIYKSVNGGNNWSQALYVADSVGAIDVVMDPNDPNKLFGAMWERQRREDYVKYGGPMTALYVTSNAGANWSIVNGGFPSNAIDMGRISLDICKGNSQVIYALTAYANGNSRGLYKSINGGVSWNLVNSSVAASSNYAWFNRICRVNPNDANNVICGGLNMERSTNGGTSFSTLSISHVDEHVVCISRSNPNFVVIGNDGGIDYSTNGGVSWNATPSLPITQFYAGDIDRLNPNIIAAGAQDNGTIRTLTGNTGDWAEMYGGDGFYCLIDYLNDQRIYASSQSGGLGRSTDGGNSFFDGTSGLDLTYSNWSTPYVMDKSNPLIMYCGTYKIHKTTNGMVSWTVISPDLANGHVQNLGTITTVDVSRSNPNVIYCGTDDANVWVTTNGGGGWTKINSGLPYRWVTRVTIHPDSANICYVSLSGYKVDSTGAHIFRTTNYGSSWTSISGNLPDAPINDIIIDPANYDQLYIATDIAVMVTTDRGVSWAVLGTGFPSNVPCHDLTFDAVTRKLVVWTHGRSAYSITLDHPVGIISNNSVPDEFRLEQNYPNPYNPSTNIKYSLSNEGFVSVKVYDGLGRFIKELVGEIKKAGNYLVKFNGSGLASGIYFYKMETGSFVETKRMLLLK